MFWRRSIAFVLVLASVVMTARAFAEGAAPRKDTAARIAQKKRGEYLANTMGCNDCHTPGALFGDPHFDRRLSGSEVGWQGPWGTTYASNLTSDLDTGLGYWNEKELANALRTGVRPDGSVLLPPMPWQSTATLTEADLTALVAYLSSVPAVSHEVPKRLGPGVEAKTPVIAMPAPGAWDAPAAKPAQ